MRYGLGLWLRDLGTSAGGKFALGLAGVSAVATIISGAYGAWPPLLYLLPLTGVIAIVWAAYDVQRRLVQRLPGAAADRGTEFDVFIAAPMAGTRSEEEYANIRETVGRVEKMLRTGCGFQRNYWAGRDLLKRDEFDPEDHASTENFPFLMSSRFLVLLYPEPLLSSVLVEFGYAFAHRVPTVIFVTKVSDLPYIMRRISQAVPWVRIYPSEDVAFDSYIENTLVRHGKRMFGDLEAAAMGNP